jgi:hypothetical protein
VPFLVRLVAAVVVFCIAAPTWAGDLRIIQTKHYTLHTDVEQSLGQDLATRLDAMYDEYDRRLSEFKNSSAEATPFEVYVFAQRADYTQFTQNRLANSGGVFMPHENRLAAFLEGQGRDGLRRTLQHEAFHQFAYRSISHNLPPWLNEGLAQLFEEGIWTGKAFILNQVPPRRTRQLQADMKAKRLIPFTDFMATTLKQWNATLADDADRGATQYNQAWAMVHFLANAGTEHGGKGKYRDRLITLLKKANAGVPADEAFVAAFSDNIEGFQDRFVEYAQALRPTKAATLIERQGVLADLLTGMVEKGMTFPNFAAFRNQAIGGGYRLSYSAGNLHWQTESDISVYFSGMDDRLFRKDELFFQPRRGAPISDLVCRPSGNTRIRCRFYMDGKSIEHEVIVEEAD